MSSLYIDPLSNGVRQTCDINMAPTARIVIGKNVSIGKYSRIGAGNNSSIEIGNNVFINNGAYFNSSGKLVIEDDCQFGPYVTIWCGDHDISDPTIILRQRGMVIGKDIRICRNVWLGCSVVVLDGITIGKNAIVGAGSIVTKDIIPNSISIGNPARVIKIFNLETKKWVVNS